MIEVKWADYRAYKDAGWKVVFHNSDATFFMERGWRWRWERFKACLTGIRILPNREGPPWLVVLFWGILSLSLRHPRIVGRF